MNNITVKHDDITITYLEHDNQWHFTLRNRDRAVVSLAEAKAIIDRPVVEKSTFKHFPAFLMTGNYSDPIYKPITVTGDAGRAESYNGGRSVWIKEGTKRSKQYIQDIFADTPENRAIIESIRAQVEIREVAKMKIHKAGDLTQATINPEEE